MKWPASITMVRHGESAYNALRARKEKDPDYARFVALYSKDYTSKECQDLAEEMWQRHRMPFSDYETPLSDKGCTQGFKTGAVLKDEVRFKPDVILVSPYLRTNQTLEEMRRGGFKTEGAKVIVEDRIRELEHGLATLYNDWRIFHVKHPEQKLLREQMGPYWYQYPQGESVSGVRDRTRDVTTMMIREFAGLHVWMITHHLTILSIRANYERLSPEQFIELDEHQKPVNCGVTRYVCNHKIGRGGRLELTEYNTKHY